MWTVSIYIKEVVLGYDSGVVLSHSFFCEELGAQEKSHACLDLIIDYSMIAETCQTPVKQVQKDPDFNSVVFEDFIINNLSEVAYVMWILVSTVHKGLNCEVVPLEIFQSAVTVAHTSTLSTASIPWKEEGSKSTSRSNVAHLW